MATFKSDAVASDMTYLGTAQPGVVMCRSGKIKGTFAANDVLEMVTVPKGAMVLDVQLVYEAFAASSTVNVGDSGDADRYFSALSVDTAGSKSSADDGAAATAHNVVYPKDTVIKVTNLSAQSADKAVTAHVFYKMVDGYLTDETSTFPAVTL